MTKAAELIALNTANTAAGERQGFQMPLTYQDFIDPKKPTAETKEQSPAEIKKKILGRFKRMGGGK
jgi:hypothetical protein